MERLFITLANMSITAGLLVLVVIAARLVFRKLPRWIFCILWGLVAVRLLIPYSFESRFSLIPSAAVLPADIVKTAHPRIHSGIAAIDEIINRRLSPSLYNGSVNFADPSAAASESGIPEYETGVTAPDDHFTGEGYGSLEGRPYDSANPTQVLSFILSGLWLAGMLGMLIYALVSYLLLRRRVMTAVRLEGNVFESEYAASPFLLGIIRPRIYLPYGLGEDERKYVTAHERAHIARLDYLWKLLGFVLLAVYWFNPLMWVAYILLCRDIESACDEKVIDGMQPEQRREYSNTLLNVSNAAKRRYIAACPLAFGEVGVKNRIKSVMNYKKPVFWIVAAAIAGCAVLAVCFLTDPVKNKANGADSQTGNEDAIKNEDGMQPGAGNEAGLSTEIGNETGISAVPGNEAGNNDNLQMNGNSESMIDYDHLYSQNDSEGLNRSEGMFSNNMYDAVREDWDKWEEKDLFSRTASSHTPGFCSGKFETWDEAVKYIGIEPWNPLENADRLKKMNYTGADITDPFNKNMLPHCSAEWIGTKDDKLTFAGLTTGYTDGDIRVTLRIELYNAYSRGDTALPNSFQGGRISDIMLTETYHERAVAKQADFRLITKDGYCFDYTLRCVNLATGKEALEKPEATMSRIIEYMGMGDIPATTAETADPGNRVEEI